MNNDKTNKTNDNNPTFETNGRRINFTKEPNNTPTPVSFIVGNDKSKKKGGDKK